MYALCATLTAVVECNKTVLPETEPRSSQAVSHYTLSCIYTTYCIIQIGENSEKERYFPYLIT